MKALFTRMAGLFLVVMVGLTLVPIGLGLAQEADAPLTKSFDLKAIMDVLLKVLVPSLWVACGPIAVAFITKGVNTFAKAYVPRSVQVVISGALTAALAGFTGDAVGVASGVQAVGTGLGTGLLTQTLAATQPSTLLTEAEK